MIIYICISWIGKYVKAIFWDFAYERAGSKRAVRNGVRKRNAHVRAQDLKSERANARVNAQMRKWGAGVNAQVREQSARITAEVRTFTFPFLRSYKGLIFKHANG